MEKFTLVSKVGAQGFGYRNLNVLQRYWSGFRDMAYALMIIPIIVLAFMIMFRVKISPQVVISVQSALPKIFVALLLATFSFAIAGFMIDLMYVVAGLFASLLNLGGLAGNFRDAYEAITFVKISGVVGGFAILFNLLAYTVMFLLSAVISFIPTIVGGLFGALASLFAIVITVWLVLLALWYTIKIPWVLIKTLISIYFSVLLAPIMIVGGIIIPSIGFGPWLRRLAADLLVFPTTGLTIYFAWMTLWFSFEINGRMLRLDFLLPNGGLWGNNPGSLWAPPLIGSSDNMTGLLFLFMSFGIIAVTPKIAEFVKAAVMGERIAFGTAMGEAVSPLQAAWGATGAPIVGETRRYGALRGTEWALTALRTRTPLGRFQVVQKAQESAQKQRESYEEGR